MNTIPPNPTFFAAIGAVSTHFIFLFTAGYLFINQDRLIPSSKKPLKLEIVKKKLPPPVKKQPIQKASPRKQKTPTPVKPQIAPVLHERSRIHSPTTSSIAQASVPKAIKITVANKVTSRKTIQATPDNARVAPSQTVTPKVMQIIATEKATSRETMQANPSNVPITSQDVSAPRTFHPDRSQPASRIGTIHREETSVAKIVSSGRTGPRTLQPYNNTTQTFGKGKALVGGTAKRESLPSLQARKAKENLPLGNRKGIVKADYIASGLLIQTEFHIPRAVPSFASGDALEGYAQGIKLQIESQKRYPSRSKRQGNEGTVVLRFTILKTGEIRDLELISGSPFDDINEAALKAVRKAMPFPNLPDEIGRDFLKLVIPFNFELKK